MAHAALVIWVPGCSVATWWQVGIAESGDSLGWVYSVMWPCFALFGIVFWWFLVHDDPDTLGRRGLRRAGSEHAGSGASEEAARQRAAREEALTRAEEADPELADYNAYLAALAQQDRAQAPGDRRRLTSDSSG